MGWMMSCELVSKRMNKREISMFRLPKGRTLRAAKGCRGSEFAESGSVDGGCFRG